MFSLATKEDDEELQSFLRTTSMPGAVRLTFGRHPSFFIAEQAGSDSSQTMVYRKGGEVYGVGSRAVRKLWVDGQVRDVGYLSSLRLAPKARGTRAFLRGYQFLHKLHSDEAVDYYISTILKENTYAQSVLEKGTSSMPRYELIDEIAVCLIPIRYRQKRRHVTSLRRARSDDVECLVHRLSHYGKHHQFSPVYQKEDIMGTSPLLPGLSFADFFISEEGPAGGMVAAWNQNTFKQTMVAGYSQAMTFARPLYNAYAALRRRPGFPAVGKDIKLVHLSHFVPSGDATRDLDILLEVCAEYSGKGFDYAAVGFSTRDPLFRLARRHAEHITGSRVYVVYWPDENPKLPSQNLPLHLEVATL